MQNGYHTLNPNINKSNKLKKLFLLFSIFIIYTLCLVASIIYIFLIPHSEDITDNIADILNITDFSDVVDTTDILDYIDHIRFINFDLEYRPIERSILRDQFNEFIKLFIGDKDTYINSKFNNYSKYIKSYSDLYTVINEQDIKSEKEYFKADIIKPLLRYNLDSLAKDVSDLQDQVSLLKIDLQNKEIQSIDARRYYENSINLVLYDLEQMQNKINSSPKL